MTTASKFLHICLGSLLALTATTASVRADDTSYVLVTPSRIGVNKFLGLGKTGIEKAAEAQGAKARIFEGTDPSTRRQNVQAAIDMGAPIVTVMGFEFGDIIADLAPENPETKFVIIDTCIPEAPENVYCAVFREQEIAYLAGAEAALTSQSKTVAVIGALDIPFLHRYTDSYELGAKAANPDINVLPTAWIGGDNPFQDPVRAQTQAVLQLSNGADRIYAVAAGSNGGVFKAAAEKPGAMAIGLDVNQCGDAPGAILDSTLKRVDVILPATIDGILKGTAKPVESFGLAEGGLELIAMSEDLAASGCMIAKAPDVIGKLTEIQAKIVSGAITVPDPMAQ
ncbi:BMP family ABC transporter substrate-binding protein [Ensifer adhaerens]|uniref:BMP family ABC transporter substrate-binding protein n=1 Tax=Ensifer adhaerens TaxID=106592 RepID=UPI00144538B3|nr:BMP family ABC transporter substrate-binding protein [Ensifer adhaerens]MDF8357220.1 BMP family ABC transporter substrate-binding protein [Ensifer adhaerens]